MALSIQDQITLGEDSTRQFKADVMRVNLHGQGLTDDFIDVIRRVVLRLLMLLEIVDMLQNRAFHFVFGRIDEPGPLTFNLRHDQKTLAAYETADVAAHLLQDVRRQLGSIKVTDWGRISQFWISNLMSENSQPLL